jgi:hypothetical protein
MAAESEVKFNSSQEAKFSQWRHAGATGSDSGTSEVETIAQAGLSYTTQSTTQSYLVNPGRQINIKVLDKSIGSALVKINNPDYCEIKITRDEIQGLPPRDLNQGVPSITRKRRIKSSLPISSVVEQGDTQPELGDTELEDSQPDLEHLSTSEDMADAIAESRKTHRRESLARQEIVDYQFHDHHFVVIFPQPLVLGSRLAKDS